MWLAITGQGFIPYISFRNCIYNPDGFLEVSTLAITAILYIAVNYGEPAIFYCWVSFYSVESENWSAVSESRSRLLFVLAHNYDNSSWTSQAPLPTKTIICQYSGPPDSELQFYKLRIKKIRHFFLLTICYIYFIHLKNCDKLLNMKPHSRLTFPHFYDRFYHDLGLKS